MRIFNICISFIVGPYDTFNEGGHIFRRRNQTATMYLLLGSFPSSYIVEIEVLLKSFCVERSLRNNVHWPAWTNCQASRFIVSAWCALRSRAINNGVSMKHALRPSDEYQSGLTWNPEDTLSMLLATMEPPNMIYLLYNGYLCLWDEGHEVSVFLVAGTPDTRVRVINSIWVHF